MIAYFSKHRQMPVAVVVAGLVGFFPLLAATPKAWFKADSITVANGQAVTAWTDSSNNGYSAQPGSGTPTFASTAMNGFPAVHFDGTQTMMLARPVQDDFSIMVLFKTPNGGGSGTNFYQGAGLVSGEKSGVTNDFGMGILSDGKVVAGSGNPDRTAISNGSYDDNNPQIATFTRARSTGVVNLYINTGIAGNSPQTGGTQSLNAPPNLYIGSHPGPVGPYFNGDIAEIIVYEGTLSASEQAAHANALRGKYAISGGTVPFIPSNVGANGVRISWDESIGAASYKIMRSDSSSGPFTMIAENLTSDSYVDPSPLPGVAGFYQVIAVNGVGGSSASATVEGSTPALPANGPVLINEIHYNGLNNTVLSDFIELYNFSSSAVDISGWTLSKGVDFTFPPGTSINPGGFLVVAQDPATLQTLWGATALGPYEKALSSDGETIRLKDDLGTLMAEVIYKSGFPWPCAANGEGASAELINPTLDATLGSSWRPSVTPTTKLTAEIASPGQQNFQYTANPAPNIEQVAHTPAQPTSTTPVTITARLTDADGISAAVLSYQSVAPGNYIPAKLPLPIVNHQIDTSQPLPDNPAFENPANWTVLVMTDDGTGGDATAGDGVFTAVIPAQVHRTLLRYRVTATDGQSVSARAPFPDDESRNFACFVYDGVPDYQGTPSATLTSLPVYQFLSRKADYDQCVAYNSADQLSGFTPSWSFENWECCMVFDGVVYDHLKFRLHGGNGRYNFSGKRGFRFFFNKGYDFQNRDNDGDLLPTRWKSMTTQNCWENRGTLTYCLNEMLNFYLWRKVGVPAPRSNWGHFRTITTSAEQADQHHGDFWGLIMIQEDYNVDFLDSHGLAKGNLYKLTRDVTSGLDQLRYQAPDAVSDGSDHDMILDELRANKGEAYLRRYVNVDKWSYYHAVCQAVRHYDYWPTGDNNAAYYFEPDYTDQTDHLGKLWTMPNDVDATWGPTWNEGKDVVYAAIFNSPTNPGIYPTYFNAVREVRDLMWQPDQINPLLDQFSAVIAPFINADSARWKGAPADAGNYNNLHGPGMTSLANLVTDMRNFAWVGGTWDGGNVGAGGRAAFMDNLQLGVSNSEGATMPVTPLIAYQGPPGYPTNELSFDCSTFQDPQGAGDFAAMQWRVAEITDPSAPAYDPNRKFQIEWDAEYDTGPLAVYSEAFTVPGEVCETGRAYRVRVRHMDVTGRWSHWSAPVQFIAGENTDNLPVVVSELLYKPTDPTPEEIAAGFDNEGYFEYLELRNTGSLAADLSGCEFTKGIGFIFPENSILAAGESTLLVANLGAFELRYGGGRPVAGAYVGNLSNGGERLLLANTSGTPLIDFTYSDSAPWPTTPDTDGYSLVLISPESEPDPNLSSNWRASNNPGGAPGFIDETTFATWATANNVIGGMTGDDDADGLTNFLEYALVTDPQQANPPTAGEILALDVDETTADYLTTSFRRQLNAADLSYRVLHSSGLDEWQEDAVRVSEEDHHDGTMSEVWRAPAPVSAADRSFLRVGIGQE